MSQGISESDGSDGGLKVGGETVGGKFVVGGRSILLVGFGLGGILGGIGGGLRVS